jgi:hypothetical protein
MLRLRRGQPHRRKPEELMRTKHTRLGKDAVLWEQGDVARDVAVVESGRLGIRTDSGIVGIALPRMVVGESAADAGRLGKFTTWDRFQHAFTLLYELRDLSDRLLGRLGPEPSQRLEMIENASQALGQIGEGVDVLPLVESYLQAERAKTEWWARG